MENSAENEEPQSYSVQLRLRRVTYEDSYVAVPIDEKVLLRHEDGTDRIDFEKLVAEAIRISNVPGTDWQVESREIDAHPTQAARPENRGIVDSFFLSNEQ
ncbi:hypothetical protein [Hymenobacter negativus]|uniref:Uncharacterized protein n=1 Tax=Hymenobacter negativus TaxID=2795026 RepID=A0ABS0Q7T3_9BACT|nr:hypothetical protein [Hymenobacter negativus]MBH8558721.1 hypothetical protein [Hymenobacter negativus]